MTFDDLQDRLNRIERRLDFLTGLATLILPDESESVNEIMLAKLRAEWLEAKYEAPAAHVEERSLDVRPAPFTRRGAIAKCSFCDDFGFDLRYSTQRIMCDHRPRGGEDESKETP